MKRGRGFEGGNVTQIKKLGLIINPIAGMGGSVGLKGTDGEETLIKALKLGASPKANLRAKEALSELIKIKDHIIVVTYGRSMGENICKELGFKVEVVGYPKNEKTTADDTINAALKIISKNVTLLLFCGGDGTAVDVLKAVDLKLPVLGIPAGVKMHSAVFAVSPKAAGKLALKFLTGGLPVKEMEVMDVDEYSFRRGIVSAELIGYMLVPYEEAFIQGAKVGSPQTLDDQINKESIATRIVEEMEPDVFYILGPGTTIKAIGDKLKIDKTLLGVDIVLNGKLIVKDANERQILDTIDNMKAKIIVTPIGNQGFIFGRGNQQISPQIIRKVGIENILIVSTIHKLLTLKCLRIDTGDSNLDREFPKYMRVITGYSEERVVKVEVTL
ncbi:MAG: ATP-NAD kinase family protein [Candidatus Odinarchaeia archaeon]